jgi:precorrin-6B methylase 2
LTISFKEFIAANNSFSDSFKPNLTTELLANNARELIQKNSYKNILDIGCGSGWIALWLKYCFPELTITGSDSHQQSITNAQEISRALNIDIQFKCSNLFTQLKDQSFDFIICDVSGISSTVAKLSDWFQDADPPLDEDGVHLITQAINNAYNHLHNDGSIIAPIISLCNKNKFLDLTKEKFCAEEIKSKDWPAPTWAYESINLNVLLKLKKSNVISFEEKFGLIIFKTAVYLFTKK